ncbi:MAG TPA: metal-dependent hydrolase [Sphingomicrobium sp.]
MENLTHSLVGAVLGRMGLKRLTPYAMPALIVAANLPDIDSFIARPLGVEPIAEHRGFTHGIGGMVTMPFLAAAIILVWQKFRPSKEGPVRLGGLLICCFVATLSHPLLDYITSYGTRLLEPFSHRWFYGDAIFIVDPWIWIMLILGLEMSWRAERLGRNWTRPAMWAFAAVLAYVALNFAISARAVAVTRPLVERVAVPRMIEAGEVPITFWKRKMIWRGDTIGGTGTYNPLDGLNRAWLSPQIVPLNLDDPGLAAAAKRNSHVRAFLFWSRMPMVHLEDGHAYLTDQRFFESGRALSSNFLIPLDNRRPSP